MLILRRKEDSWITITDRTGAKLRIQHRTIRGTNSVNYCIHANAEEFYVVRSEAEQRPVGAKGGLPEFLRRFGIGRPKPNVEIDRKIEIALAKDFKQGDSS